MNPPLLEDEKPGVPHLSISFWKEVSEADVLRLALDGHLNSGKS